MTKLTEDMIIARTKTSDLSTIKKLNCWGSDLDDIGLIRRLINVEVLSLSVNKIKSLAEFRHCRNLVELYIRQNDIRDLSELCYLQDLPKLKRLLLTENPCVLSAGTAYRNTVLRALPTLEMLDNEPVSQEELDQASKVGLILVHPSERMSPQTLYYQEGQSPLAAPVNQGNQRSPQQCDYEDTQYLRGPNNDAPVSPPVDYYYQNGDDRTTPRSRTPEAPPVLPFTNTGPPNANGNIQYHQHPPPSSPRNLPIGSPERLQFNHLTPTMLNAPPTRVSSGIPNWGQPSPRGKASNLLSAVLCLIPELDQQSLEVLELAVRRRMDEM